MDRLKGRSVISLSISLSTKKRGYTMADNKEEKTIDIEVDLDEEPVELGYQGKTANSQDASVEELKQQAGELLKAAGGLAGSLGKFAAKKGGELKDKISDEEIQEKVKSSAKAYADKAGTVINSGAAKAEDVIKESTASVMAKTAQKSQNVESAKASASTQNGGKGGKKLGVILLAVVVVVAGIIAVISGGNEEQPATEEPVAEETTEETKATEEPTADTETTEEPLTVYYSTNTEDTVKDGNKGIYSYRSKGGTYDVYYIIDFDEGYVYSFTDGNGEDYCDKVEIESGDLNDVVMVTYDFDGDLAPYGFHFKYKNNPEHLVVQDNNGLELDFSPTGLSDALAIRDGKTITKR